MSIDPNTAVEGVLGAITAIGGLYTAAKHVVSRSKRKKKLYRASILEEANSEMCRIEANLEEKIKDLEIELKNQKENVSRDLGHLREVYNAEIKVLGDRIEALRQDLNSQHSSLVSLLTKLVDRQ